MGSYWIRPLPQALCFKLTSSDGTRWTVLQLASQQTAAQQALPAEVPSTSGGLDLSHAEPLQQTAAQLPEAAVTSSTERGSYLQPAVLNNGL